MQGVRPPVRLSRLEGGDGLDETVQRDFTEFVRLRGHLLFRISFSVCRQQQAAEDRVQTALARASLKWRWIEGDPEPYVKRILYRQFVSAWRWRRSRPEEIVGDLPEAVADGDHAERTALRLSLERMLD